MRKLLLLVTAMLLILASVFAQDVYVGGKNGTVWKNTNPTILTTEYSSISSVLVANGNVYSAGYDAVAGTYDIIATVWKNETVLYTLGNGSIASIAVAGSDVYAAGGSDVGKMWKNGVAEEGYADATALSSVFLDGNDVYAAGYSGTFGDPVGKVWKNGALLFTMGIGGLKAVVVSGGDVYTAGYIKSDNRFLPTVWKNENLLYTMETTGHSSGFRMGLSISNGDIYVAGYNPKLCGGTVWKNGGSANGGQTIEVRSGSRLCNAYSVFVTEDGDIYVAGEVSTCGNYAPAMWKNGDVTILADFGTAYSIFVAPEGSSNFGIAETDNYSSIRTYPNPTTGMVSIETESHIKVYNLQGVFLQETYGKQIDLSAYPQGIYFLRIKNEVVKVVKL